MELYYDHEIRAMLKAIDWLNKKLPVEKQDEKVNKVFNDAIGEAVHISAIEFKNHNGYIGKIEWYQDGAEGFWAISDIKRGIH